VSWVDQPGIVSTVSAGVRARICRASVISAVTSQVIASAQV